MSKNTPWALSAYVLKQINSAMERDAHNAMAASATDSLMFIDETTDDSSTMKSEVYSNILSAKL